MAGFLVNPVEVQEILKNGGATGLLIILLIGGLVMLWRYHLSQVKGWTETQAVDTRAMIASSERSTSAIINLTELLKANAAMAAAYQTEMRSRVYGELDQLQKFRGEVGARLDEIGSYISRKHIERDRDDRDRADRVDRDRADRVDRNRDRRED